MSPSNTPGRLPEIASSSGSEPVRPLRRRPLHVTSSNYNKRQNGNFHDRHSDCQPGAGDVSLDHLIYPDEDVGYRPVLRSHRTAHQARKDTCFIPKDRDSQSDEEFTPLSKDSSLLDMDPVDHFETISAGPDALAALRKHISAALLARLPDLSDMEFSRHSKPSSIANLRLVLGTYTDRSIKKWGNTVYAYLSPNANSSIGPKFVMEVDERHGYGGHDVVEVTWYEAIFEQRVATKLPFKQAATKDELYAVVKYYFLLAVEAGVDNFHHDFIPLNRSFVQHLTSLCLHYVPDLRTPTHSTEGYTYDEEPPPRYPTKFDRRRPPGYEKELGVAKVHQFPQVSIDASGVDPGKSDNSNADGEFASLQRSRYGKQASRMPGFAAEPSLHISTQQRRKPITAFLSNYRSALPRPLNRGEETLVRGSTSPRNAISSWLKTVAEELNLHPDALPTKARPGKRRELKTNESMSDEIDWPLRGLSSQSSVSSGYKDLDHFSNRDQSSMLSGTDNSIYSFPDQHAWKPDDECASLTRIAMTEPLPDKYRHDVEWRAFRTATASLPGVDKDRRERRTSRKAERSRNPIANRHPSSTCGSVVSTSLLQRQKKVIDSRVEKTLHDIEDHYIRLKKLRKHQISIKAEMVEAKRREEKENRFEDDEMMRWKDEEDGGNDSNKSRFLRLL
ncbi:hypothetical protein J4E83_009718 [Alternaria metachromatica]|uniref:uncharacterized protein n=1 Tax=Alternaria metachromatica TaxID=283354 RepID=UPI0020C4E2FF|nr:uncharacterized protein J4E83_009718 [Alternaria metachromatica]KAI4607262.1 hypothetical protein J4E83_009718 [Alternaria metachromatica]